MLLRVFNLIPSAICKKMPHKTPTTKARKIRLFKRILLWCELKWVTKRSQSITCFFHQKEKNNLHVIENSILRQENIFTLFAFWRNECTRVLTYATNFQVTGNINGVSFIFCSRTWSIPTYVLGESLNLKQINTFQDTSITTNM